MRVPAFLATMGLLALSIGCGTKSSKKNEIIPLATYDGIWRTGCVQGELGEYRKSLVTITGNSKVVVRDIYPNNDWSCSEAAYTLTYSVDFTIGNDVDKVSGAKEIDEQATKGSIVMHYPYVVSQFNKTGLCGSKSWEVGVSQDLSKNGCPLLFIPIYNIFKRDGNKVFYGLRTHELDGSSPSARPAELESTFMTKQ